MKKFILILFILVLNLSTTRAASLSDVPNTNQACVFLQLDTRANCSVDSDCDVVFNACGYLEAIDKKLAKEYAAYNRCIAPIISCPIVDQPQIKENVRVRCNHQKCTILSNVLLDQSQCPGWAAVPLDWNKSVGEFCAQFGEVCKAVSSRYDTAQNEMQLDPLFGVYDARKLMNPDAVLMPTDSFQAREIKCDLVVYTEQQKLDKENNERLRNDCEENRGQWEGQSGRGRIQGCNLPTKDAGKLCSDSSECESACVADKVLSKNICYGWQSFKGCGKIESGEIICVD